MIGAPTLPLKLGATGEQIKDLQRTFVKWGRADIPSITGTFDLATQTRVIDYQREIGVKADGVVELSLQTKLILSPTSPLLKLGDTRPEVGELNEVLRAMADSSEGGLPPIQIPLNDVFGNLTDAAVKAYQIHLGLSGDGKVGDRTWWTPGKGGLRLYDRVFLTT